jgi:PPM family protein phosphatase
MSEKVGERIQERILQLEHIASWLGRPKSDSAAAPVENLRIALGSSTNLRAENQDRVVVARFLSPVRSQCFALFAVADGIGGMKEGGRCADLALATLISELAASNENLPKLRLTRALNIANETLYSMFRERGGTTLAMIYATPTSHPIGLNVGDSRIYQFLDGAALKQISTDDNVQSQMRLLSPSQEKPVAGQIGRQLTQFVGMNGPIDPRSFLELTEGAYLLTSDGAHAQGAEIMRLIIANSTAPLDTIKRLMLISRWIGTKDNASALFANSIRELFENVEQSGGNTCELWDPGGQLTVLWEFSRDTTVAHRRGQKRRKKSGSTSNERRHKDHRADGEKRGGKTSDAQAPKKVDVSFELVDDSGKIDAH